MAKTIEEMKSFIKNSIPSAAHVCIAVKDMETSIKFYTEILGFEVRHKCYCGINQLAFLTHKNIEVEFVQFTNPEPDACGRCYETLAGVGRIWHICMYAEREAMPVMIEYFKEMGIPVTEGLRENPDVHEGSRCFFIFGPDGEQIEFMY